MVKEYRKRPEKRISAVLNSCGLHCCFAIAAVASVPPNPMVSTADDGTITI